MSEPLVWVLALPLGGALVATAWPRRAQTAGLVSAVLTSAAALAVLQRVAGGGARVVELGGWTPGLGIALRADGLSAALLALTAAVALAGSVYATGYFSRAAERARFWPLWLLLWAALNALLLAADLFNLYVTLELLGLSAVALTALGGQRGAVEAALRYLLVGLLGSMAYLAGVALLYAAYGSLDLATVAARIGPEPAAWAALALMTGGLLLKAALFPLHFWLPPAHAGAPAPVSAALSALVVKAAFYLVLRLWLDLFAPVATPGAAGLLGALGGAAVLWGSWRALRAERLKVLAAYSTVAQLGYLFLYLWLVTALPEGPERTDALGALVLLALTHGLAKAALFLAAGVVQQRAGHDRIDALGGTAQRLPATTFAIAMSGVALVGLPPSGTFLAKWQLLASAFALGNWTLVAVVTLGSLLAGAYVFRLLGHAFGHLPSAEAGVQMAREEIPALALAVAATLVLGLAAAPLWTLIASGGGGAP
ncbi:MAG: proton-conducting transporter membrane subunit [Chromatiales bacterium]|jgi:formate hydrogenlyase subunit 3/multisubunit Na+/H+ antiporter MnhD subunit